VPRFVRNVLPSQFGTPIDCRAAIQGNGYTNPQSFEITAFVVSSASSDTAPNATSPGVSVSWIIPVNGIASYTVGNDPRDIILDSNGYLWITCYAAGTIQKIDRVTGAVISTVTVGTKPYGITFGSGSLWVTVGAVGGTSAVKRVDPIGLTVTNTITLTSGSDPVGIIHDGTNVWGFVVLAE
jgi:YVTN family beta-propeller protein